MIASYEVTDNQVPRPVAVCELCLIPHLADASACGVTAFTVKPLTEPTICQAHENWREIGYRPCPSTSPATSS